jgi:hypothetical protein
VDTGGKIMPQEVGKTRVGKPREVRNVQYGKAKEETEADLEGRDLEEFHQKAEGGKYSGMGGIRQRTGSAYDSAKRRWLGARAGQRFLKKQPKENLMSKLKIEPYAKGLSSLGRQG